MTQQAPRTGLSMPESMHLHQHGRDLLFTLTGAQDYSQKLTAPAGRIMQAAASGGCDSRSGDLGAETDGLITETTSRTRRPNSESTSEHTRSSDAGKDIFDDIVMLEQQWFREGHQSAELANGGGERKRGRPDEDAFRTGVAHGGRLGFELGFMQGVAAALQCAELFPEHGDQVTSSLNKLTAQLNRIEVYSPGDESFVDDVDISRGLFLKACARARVRARLPGTADPSSSW